MNYATFWQRLGAMLIDFFVITPPSLFLGWLQSSSKIAACILVIPLAASYCGYTIYCHGRFGQTVGKHVMRIRVMRMTGERIGWREAWLRSLVDVAYSILYVISMFYALATISDANFYGAGWPHVSRNLQAASPAWFASATSVEGIWMWSEVIVMLFNKRRRALHDFIAGTVVVAEQKVSAIQPLAA